MVSRYCFGESTINYVVWALSTYSFTPPPSCKVVTKGFWLLISLDLHWHSHKVTAMVDQHVVHTHEFQWFYVINTTYKINATPPSRWRVVYVKNVHHVESTTLARIG